MFDNLKIMWHQGKQFIPDVTTAKVPGIFRGRPVISNKNVDETALEEICPTHAISKGPVRIDLGKCTFCGECAIQFPNKIRFTSDYKISSNEREKLIIIEGDENPILVNPDLIRKEIHRLFGGSLKLRQVSAAGDNSCEWELNASNNVQFDVSRFGIDFVASPRHADGIVITGPISENMAEPLERCYHAVPDPKIIILAGTDAISGGIFADSPALDRSFLSKYHIDLYIPGNPVHPLTFINGVLSLLRKI
ncbi:MAG: NADH:ubiquinone oxidoreductase [Bacteroidetes bacterium GWF2_42_66]|nr:MAG: NADH:ubiquinone oxidoreductase [Bacteroidetes bacterium GWA2_42_15]OFX97545.1 MAG: NADH:ubiquinone oxidoreductase [Bacteroidetes bacterium GWE2_42_39]OFY43760.1 MAG: NADH:ubiquinone oxidoreductase [Bacteroidetes bacterium GWF2_42_66]HAZ04743.1 NADH:ubiquinone oxidoreductase [Marinilabiliales bacterium]HBL76264.1 NADH:ubiquinone oxidoreductase [Prolixibacteraceae bacterium]